MAETAGSIRGATILSAVIFAAARPSTSFAQSDTYTVTVAIDSLRSDDGRVTGSLCDDPAVAFCSTYVARTTSSGGQAELRFERVRPGRYSLSTVHDVNGDGRTQTPPDGAAFGNNSAVPHFASASVLVQSDMTTSVSMTYPGVGPARMGSHGVPPPAGIVRVDVRDNGLYGELYAPENADGALPAIILIDGGNGGLDGVSVLAANFAQHGYAALALAYFAETGLPPTLEGVPMEYFDAAVAWLQARRGVDGGAIGVLGVSRGAEAALLLGARNQAVRAVIAVGPSNGVWQGYDPADPANGDAAFTSRGEAVSFLRPDMSLYEPNGPTTPLYDSALRMAGDDPAAAIPVERVNGPILLIAGENDEVWPSPDMARRIVDRLARAGFAHEVESIVLPGSHYVFANSAVAMTLSIDFLDAALSPTR